MARTLSQIQRELAAGDKAQRDLINQQLKGLPGQFAGQRSGLEAQQRQAFGDILSGAKSRGLKFSGIPLAEQAEFTSTQFLPALAQLSSQQNQQSAALRGGLADILAQRAAQAQSIRQTELNREAQEVASRRSAAAAQQSSLGSILQSVLGGGEVAQQTQREEQKFSDTEKARALKQDAQEFATRLEASIPDGGARLRIFQGLLKRSVDPNKDRFTQQEARFKAQALSDLFNFRLPETFQSPGVRIPLVGGR